MNLILQLPEISEQAAMNEQFRTHPIANLLTAVRLTISRGVAAWHRFWFEPLDPLMLGIIRLLTGWFLFYNLLTWSFRLEMFFGRNGVQPLETVKRLYESRYIFTFWLWIDDQYLWPVHIACMVIAAMFFVGAATRLTSILAFVITISYSQRVPVANFGFDQILGMMCLYLAMAPSGAAVSVDNLIRKRWRRKKGGALHVVPVRFASARMASRLIQLHLCAIYFWSGFSKLKGPTWWTGEALWNVIANQEYQTLDLTWMAWIPWLPYLIAHITVAWETSFIVLVWNRRLRPFVLAIGTAMHVGIGAFLGMWTFGLIMTFAYLTFCDPETWRERLARWQSRISPKALSASSAVNAVANESLDTSTAQGVDCQLAELPGSADCVLTADQPLVPRFAPVVPMPAEIRSVLVIALAGQHRNTLRDHFCGHGFECRAVDSGERAMELLGRQKYKAVVIQGNGYFGTDPVTLVSDLLDYGNVPVLVLLTGSQSSLRPHFDLMSNVECCLLPASLREIRGHLEAMIARS